MEEFEIQGVRVTLERAEDRNTPAHKRIVCADPIGGTRSGNYVLLECGHRVQTFGPLSNANGVVLCTACQEMQKRSS